MRRLRNLPGSISSSNRFRQSMITGYSTNGLIPLWSDSSNLTVSRVRVGKRTRKEGEIFKSTLQSFIRLYGFLSQIIEWQDTELEKLYAYSRHLFTKLPRRSGEGMLELDDEVALSHYRNEMTIFG